MNSHAHLDFDTVNKTNDICIVPAIGKQNWHKVIKFDNYALGIHPWFIEAHNKKDLADLEEKIKNSSPVAIGECGLDFAKNIDKDKQLFFFEQQLKLAQKYQLPVIVHAVKSTEKVILILKKYPKIKGAIHGFSGSLYQAQRLVKMGFKLGFGLQIINPKSIRLQKIVAQLPLESILLETDAHKNPDDLILVVQKIAKIKKISIKKTAQQCDNNVFSLLICNGK